MSNHAGSDPARETEPGRTLPANLVRAMAEQHRPRRRRDTMAAVEQYVMWCKACDGHNRRVWRPGDEPVECTFVEALRTVGIDVSDPLELDE